MSQELRVLIIEDDPDVRLGCEQAMMLADLPVEGVGSAEEGLARLKAGFPGIVVTDMRLPRADGMEVLRRCQAMDADLPVPVSPRTSTSTRVAATSLTSWRTRAICGERPMSLLSMPSRWARRRRRSSTSRVRARFSRARRTTSTSRSGAKGFWMKS